MAPFWCLSILSLAALAAAIDIPGANNNGVAVEAAAGQITPEEYLKAHNDARAAVRVPPLAWNRTLQLEARRYADKLSIHCNLQVPKAWHAEKTGYGQNLYKGSGIQTAEAVVSFWVEGRRWYDHRANACAAGKVCGTYTQVVWRDTRELGCASRICADGAGIVVACKYFPPGNYPGKLPY